MNFSPRTLAGLLTLSLWLGWGAGPAWAAELKEPYRIRIVLDFARHKLLTQVFREQVARELGDGLQAALGEMAQVEVTEEHPRLADIRARGLARALDGWPAKSEFKDHFVRIALDPSGTHYEIQARQYDGQIGLPSPVVRTARTDDRPFVARAAGLLIETDLGLLGTIQDEPDARWIVRVELKGGGLGVDLGRWVKKDEVFALRRPGEVPGQASAYLQVQEPPKDGICKCQLHSRYKLSRLSGMRCVLLGTRSGPLRLRVMQEKPDGGLTRLEAPVTLQIRRYGFEGTITLQENVDATRDVVDTAARGSVSPFNRLAFITARSGDVLLARIPVAIVDDGLTVLPVPAAKEEENQVADLVRSLERKVSDAYHVQAQMFQDINDLTAKREERARALARVKEALARLRHDLPGLSAEREEVQKEINKLPEKARPSLSAVDKHLAAIRSGKKALEDQVQVLEKIEQEENDPKRKEWRIRQERAKQLERDAELGQAIAIYEKAPAEFQTDPLKKHLDGLKERWKPKDARHAAARTFIYEVWPGLSTRGLKERWKDAREALNVCKVAGDTLGPTKMLRASEGHVRRMEQEAKELRPNVNRGEEESLKLIQELARELGKLDEEIRAFLEKAG